jgi:superfamily II DNA or RNA helicase
MDLFSPPTRDERQEMGRIRWIDNKCKGTLEYATGVGKTTTAIKCVQSVLKKYTGFRVLVVVPTETLKDQWVKALAKAGLFMNAEVAIINTVVKHEWNCDILVLDEIHRMAADSFQQVFDKVKYKLILGLTATLERLDERHTIIERYCPVCDRISIEEATQNEWLAPYKEYKVYIDVDLTEYNALNREFNEHFAFFNYDFDLCMKLVGKDGFRKRMAFRDLLYTGTDPTTKSQLLKDITFHAMGFMRTMQKRKAFIYSHPKKVEITNLILDYRRDSKAITFSPTIEVAEKIKYGGVLHSKQTKKKNAMTLEDFIPMKVGVLNTSKALNEGADIQGLNLAIILSNTSSKTEKTQRIGRVIRFSPNKVAEIFTLVLRGTVEEEWFTRSNADKKYITIDEEQLMHVLKHEEFKECKSKPLKMIFRF